MKRIVVFVILLALIATAALVSCKDKKEGEDPGTADNVVNTDGTETPESEWDSLNEVIPGVAWSDLEPDTAEPASDGETDDLDSDALESLFDELIGTGTGIELPIIPLNP